MKKRYLLLALSSCLTLAGCTKGVVQSINAPTIAAFDEHSINRILVDLIQVDIDTYHVYNNAAKHIKDSELKAILQQFAFKHEEHATTLSKLLLDRGGHPPSFSRDFKGFVTSGYVNIKVAGGKINTLEAMETNEIISNRYYSKALSTTMPRAIKEVLSSHLRDEEGHLSKVYELKNRLSR